METLGQWLYTIFFYGIAIWLLLVVLTAIFQVLIFERRGYEINFVKNPKKQNTGLFDTKILEKHPVWCTILEGTMIALIVPIILGLIWLWNFIF